MISTLFTELRPTFTGTFMAGSLTAADRQVTAALGAQRRREEHVPALEIRRRIFTSAGKTPP